MKDNFYWAVDGSPYRSDFLIGTKTFGSEDPVYLIDQYSGKRPALINEEFLKGGTISFSMYPSALLDSNVVDVLDKFVVTGGITDGWSEFLGFLTRRRWDFSAHFYYLEHFAKSPLQDFLPNAIRRTKSLLTLFSMDEDYYLKTGRIRANPEAVSHHLKEGGGGGSIDEIAKNRVASFIEGHDRHVLREMLDSVESCLIKMILIKRFEMKAAPASEQYGEFVRFMQQDLGISLARENHFAMHYFAGRGGRLLGVQPNTSYTKAVSIVRSTAWDMYLLRMPEIFFSKPAGELCIPYVATQEKRLHELARQFSIERIENFSGIGFAPKIGFKMDEYLEGLYSELPGLVGEARGGIRHVPVGLVEALNRQLAFYCP